MTKRHHFLVFKIQNDANLSQVFFLIYIYIYRERERERGESGYWLLTAFRKSYNR
jgi:hypothetical protein